MSQEAIHVPPYLLKTAFGEKLQQKLGNLESTVEGDNQIARLGALGVMGNMPGRYSQSGYDNQLAEMLRSTNSTSSSADINNTNNSTTVDIAMDDTEDDYLSSIHYNHDNMDIDGEDEDDDDDIEAYEDAEDIDHFSNRSLSRRASRKSSRSRHSFTTVSSFKYPLPLKWEPTSNSSLVVFNNGLGLRVESIADHSGSSSLSKNYDYFVTRADTPIPIRAGIFYFEFRVTSVTNNNVNGTSDISVGFLDPAGSQTVAKMPGLEAGSYGFSGTDGKITANQSSISKTYSRKFGLNDVIGCGVNFSERTIFFTKNGVNLGVAFHDVYSDLIPIMGLRNGNSVITNFGQSEFIFDIDGYVNSEKVRVQKLIFNSTNVDEEDTPHAESSNDTKINEYTDKEIPSLLQKLVGAYFEHLGYVDVSKVFKQEVLEEQSAQQNGGEVMDLDEENLEIRQQIRKYLMSGDIDSTIKLTNLKFPQVLQKDDDIYFKLQCHKFIQLIKLSEVDEAMEFGQYLRSTFYEIPKFQEFLDTIFSLIAFENPGQSELGYLLKPEELVKLSDDLNSKILKTLGKSSVSNLENLLRHNKVLLNFLIEQAHPDALLVSNQDFKP